MTHSKAEIDKIVSNSFNKKSKKEDDEKIHKSTAIDKIVDTSLAKKNINFDTFQSDLTSLSKTIDSVYNGWQSRETMENTRSSIQSMYDRLGKYQEYQKKYGGTDLSELQNSYKAVLDGWEDISNKYGQYESADAYNKEISTLKELGTMTSSDVESKLTEITDLEGILKTAKEYESKISGIRNRGNTWEHRSRGLKTDGGYADKLKVAEDELNKYLKDVGYKSVEDIEKALSGKRIAYTTVGGENITWQSLYDKKKYNEDSETLYNEISSSDDFEKYKTEGANIKNPTYDEADGTISILGFEPFAKEVQNVVEYAFENKEMFGAANAYGVVGDDREYYVHMTNQERDIHNYHLGREQAGLAEKGTAKKYLDSIYDILKDRYENADIISHIEFADEHPVLASGVSVFQNLGAGFEWMEDVGKYLATGELDDNHLAKASSSIRSTVSSNVDWEIGNWDAFDFVYNTGMSMIDSTVAMATLGNMGGVALGFSAAAQGTNDALERGLDNKSAFLSGLSAGVFEGVFESLSIGKFKALKDAPVDSVKTIIKNVGKSMLTNASEETLTELANLTYDYIANGDLSQAKTKIRAYVNAGMTEKEATRKVALEQAAQVGEAGLSGALMGIGFGGFGGAVAYSNSKHMGQTIKANERVGDVFDIASNPEVASAYDTYTQYANKGINADNITDAQLGRIYTEARADAVETLKSKKTTAEQKKGAMQTLAKLSVVETENVIKKEAKKFNVGEETKVTGSDETVDVKDLKVKDEEVIVVTEKGKLSVDDITLTQSDAELVAFAKEISKADGEDVANLFISQYDGQTDVYEYANSFNLTMAYAKNNFSYDTILNKKGVLSTESVNKIYQETRIKADKERAEYIKKLNEKMADKKFYKGFIEDSIIDYENTSAEGKINWNDLDTRQKQAVTFIKGFAQATGMNLVLEHNPDGKYNGKFEVNSNTITIDISNPGKAFQLRETIIPTMSHETTHWMKEKSPELYRHLNEIVFSTLAEHYNSNTEQAIKDKIEILKWADPEKAYTEETAKERTITEEDIVRAEVQKKGKSLDESRDEIIARACEDVLAMSERGRRIFKSLSEHDRKTLVEKLKGLVNDLLNWVNELLNSYESTSTEARIMREYKEQLQKAAKVWDEMLGKSIEANQSLEKSGAYTHGKTSEGDVLEQARALQRKDPTKLTEEDFKNLLEFAEQKMFGDDTYIPARTSTPQILIAFAKEQGHDLENHPLAMSVYKARQALSTESKWDGNPKDKPHNLTVGEVIEIVKAMNNPSHLVYQTKNDRFAEIVKFVKDGEKEKAYAIIDFFDVDKNPDLMNGYEGGKYNILVTIYPSEDSNELKQYLKNKNNIVMTGEEMKKKGISQGSYGSYVPSLLNDSPFYTNSIPNSNEKVNTKFSDRDYSYDELVAKDDLNGIVVEKKQQVKLSANGNIDADWVVNEVKKKCKILKQNASATTYYTKVPDIDNNVEIIKKGITHGFMKSVMDKNKASSDKDILNARVCLELPQILQNSIEVNRSSREGNIDIPFAHIMIGTVGLEDVNGNIDYYAVRSVIEERINQPPVLVEAGVLGKLHAVNAKKIGTPHVQVTKNGVALARSVAYTYNIAQFLEDVKTEFNDTFSEDVYQKLAMTRNVNKFSKELLFSDREDTSVYDIIGEKERLLEENKKLDVDAQNLKGIMGNEEIANKRFLGLANYLKKISGSNIDSAGLAKKLKDAYTSLQASKTLLWNDVFTKTYDIAESIMSKDLGVSAEYFRSVMHEIRKDRISLSEEQRARVEERFGSYGNFHKYVFGRANVTKDGTPLADVWKTWSKKYPALFEENASGAEQIDSLVDAVDALKTTSSVMDEYEYFEAIRHLSTEIYNQFWNIATDHAAVDKAKSYKAEHRALMENLRKDYEKRQKDIATHPVGETALKYESLLRKARETKKKEVALAKKRGRERMDKYKENAERKTRVQRITANALFLNEMLTKNSKDKHVPEILKNPVTALLQAIDFSSKRLIDNGEPTQKDISLSRALSEVQDMMVKATNAHNDLVELYGHGLDEDIKNMMKSVDNIMRTVGDNEFVLNKMTLTDLKTLDKMVRTIRHAVNKLNKFHTVNHAKGIANLSQESVLYLDSLGKGKIYDGRRGKMKKILNWNNALPYYVFKRYGSGGMKVYEALQDGWDKFAFNIKKIVDYADEVYTSNEVKEWSEEVKTFKVLIPASEMEILSEDYVPEYQEVKLTVPQIMSIYCLNKREQARKHLYQGGIRVANFKDKKGNIVSQSEGIIFTENDVQTIFDSLTERQKVVADKLQEFMNTVCADWGNDVSMARFGYKAFGEENYFPIQSDKNTRLVHDATEQPNRLFKLLNMSFTKSLDDGAKNRIVISDIFDVFAQHASDMAKYNSLALPVLDAFKWYNYTEEQDAAGGTFQTNGVQQSIENAFGEDGQKYFTTFLEDINGQQEVSRDTLGQGFFTNAKIAAVGANLRVMSLQPTSYIRAGVMIDNKYLAKALVHKPKTKSAETHCGIALWKSMGYYDTNIQRGVEAQIKHNDTWKDKAVNLSMKGAEIADKITWGYLWNACELEVRDKRRDLKVGSEEFYIEISKRLREIIYATQVVDSTMTRSQMMRSADRFDKMLTAFSSEPTLAYNMLQDAYMGLHLDARRVGKKEAWKKNGKRMARIVAAYTMTNALAALIESGFDAFRDDEEEELDMLTFMRLYLTNFASDMSITGKLPYIKELHSAIKGFGSSRSDTQWMENFVYAIRGWYKVYNGNGNATTTIKNSIQAVSELSGLPFYNAYRDLMAALNKLDLFTAEDLNEMFEDFLD